MRENFVQFVPPDITQKELLLYSDGMGFEEAPAFYVRNTNFNNYLVMYTCKGILFCEQDGREVQVRKGQAVLMDPHRPYRHYFKKEIPSRIAWCHLNGAAAVPVIEQIGALCTFPYCIDGAEVYRRLLALFEISDRADRDVYAQSEHCYGLLMHFLSVAGRDQAPPSLSSHLCEFKQKCWQLISVRLGEVITLEGIASLMSMSKYHFARTFHKVYGMPLMQFVTEERLRQAKYRLRNTTQTICSIAEDLGFSDAGYFAKVFKKHVGIPPLDYRKQVRYRDTDNR